MSTVKVYQSPASGMYHGNDRCTGLGRFTRGAKNGKQVVKLQWDRAEYDSHWSELGPTGVLVMCRCLRHNDWGQQNGRQALRDRLRDREQSYRPRREVTGR